MRCNSTVELRRINPGIEPPLFWCFNHAEKLKSNREIEKRAKVYSDSAKAQGMSNQDFCKEILEALGCRFVNRSKSEENQLRNVREILNKQNPLLEMNVEGVKN